MPVVDKQLGLRVRREFSKRASVDCSDVRVHTSGGTVYLNGRIKPNRGSEVNMKAEVEIICRNLRTIPGVREVVNELDLPN